jgi:hypothetical protein
MSEPEARKLVSQGVTRERDKDDVLAAARRHRHRSLRGSLDAQRELTGGAVSPGPRPLLPASQASQDFCL